MAKRGGAPAPQAGGLRNQRVDVEAVQEAADLGTLLLEVMTKVARELDAEVVVGESVHRVLPAHEGDKKLGIGPGHRIEGLDGPSALIRLVRGPAGGRPVRRPLDGGGVSA